MSKFQHLSHENMHDYNQRGWFPFPGESQEDYLHRIEQWNHFFSYPPKDIDNFLTDGEWEGARKRLKQMYHVVPESIVAHYCDKGIVFLQGALMWEVPYNGQTVPLIQLKKAFQYKKLCGIYSLDEVLAHETIHALRLGFKKDVFEEFFAYKASKGRLRRFLGPLFQRIWEPYLFLGVMVIAFLPFFTSLTIFPISFMNLVLALPLLYFLYLLGRLSYRWIMLGLAARHLKKIIKDPDEIDPLLFRMTDNEIKMCALKSKKWRSYLETEKKATFRWRFLYTLYF